jgi:hypothetical protein
LNWIFADYTGNKNPVQTRKKNPVHQTQNFKQEIVKNQVQIDRGLQELTTIGIVQAMNV